MLHGAILRILFFCHVVLISGPWIDQPPPLFCFISQFNFRLFFLGNSNTSIFFLPLGEAKETLEITDLLHRSPHNRIRSDMAL